MIKAVVFDADKTLWDHHNISEFEEPLKIVDANTLEDSKGRALHLFPEVRETLRELKNRGYILGLATWNYEEKAIKVLSALDLMQYFHVIVAKPFPYKFLMLSYIMIEIRNRMNVRIKPDEILFLDDRRGHFGNIWLYLGNVKCLEMWKDVTRYVEIFDIIKGVDSE
ncbi:magnesium-dependent phosphatase-1 [Sulfolobus tengchongensis]|uniref:Magnesium-dependent phosphatase-1 n=1 Tax=Sulfolobus tengchongensis TaxID=207809 RepID=A0AAX4KZ81_9CREN